MSYSGKNKKFLKFLKLKFYSFIFLLCAGFYNVFTINEDKTAAKIYSHSLLNIIPNGVYCAEIDEKNQYLIIGSNVATSSKNNSNGVFMWRVLNTEPWLKHFPVSSENLERNKV